MPVALGARVPDFVALLPEDDGGDQACTIPVMLDVQANGDVTENASFHVFRDGPSPASGAMTDHAMCHVMRDGQPLVLRPRTRHVASLWMEHPQPVLL